MKRDQAIELLKLAGVPNTNSVYILRPEQHLSSVFSQQVRALNLVRALYLDGKLRKETQVAVIGGGASGLTAAAAAALVEAKVTLFEQCRDLMPLQMGCATRALHPHVHRWPNRVFRAAAGLPILDWAAGTAHEVAQQIVGGFHSVEGFVNKPEQDSVERFVNKPEQDSVEGSVDKRKPDKQLKVVHSRARVRPGETPIVFCEDGEKEPKKFDIVIVAAGFGVERTVNNLPRNSYWRVDSLGQAALSSIGSRTLISGAGDGSLIDILRATIKDFDHGTFYDDVVQRLRPVEKHVAEFEQNAWTTYREVYEKQVDASAKDPKSDALLAAEPILKEGYERISEEIRKHLEPKSHPITLNRNLSIHWVYRNCKYEVTGFPFNRLLVWWVLDCLKRQPEAGPQSSFKCTRGAVTHVGLLDQEMLDGRRYSVTIKPDTETEPAFDQVDNVVLRHGAESILEKAFEGDKKEIEGWTRPPTRQKYPELRRFLIPWLRWDREEYKDEFVQKIEEQKAELIKERPAAPRIVATFFRNDTREIEVNRGVYRISVELKGEFKHIRWVIYDLHPERNRFERKSTLSPFRQWINSSGDIRIRARLSDGREVSQWLGAALRAGEQGQEDAVKEIENLERAGNSKDPGDARTLFKAIREWARNLPAAPSAEASPPQEYAVTDKIVRS